MHLFVLLFLSVIIPSEKTMYMIAGASIGKEAVQSDSAIKAYNLLNKYLDEELEKLTKK